MTRVGTCSGWPELRGARHPCLFISFHSSGVQPSHSIESLLSNGHLDGAIPLSGMQSSNAHPPPAHTLRKANDQAPPDSRVHSDVASAPRPRYVVTSGSLTPRCSSLRGMQASECARFTPFFPLPCTLRAPSRPPNTFLAPAYASVTASCTSRHHRLLHDPLHASSYISLGCFRSRLAQRRAPVLHN